METDKVNNKEMINALKLEVEKVFQHPMHLPRNVDMARDQLELMGNCLSTSHLQLRNA